MFHKKYKNNKTNLKLLLNGSTAARPVNQKHNKGVFLMTLFWKRSQNIVWLTYSRFHLECRSKTVRSLILD